MRPGATRVVVTGNAGAGKTTLALAPADALCLPYRGLDGIVWQERWGKTPDTEKRERIAELVAGDGWVVDAVSEQVLRAADVAIFLDVPRSVSAARLCRRNARYLFRSRPGLPAHCPEILVVPKLARLVWRFPTHVRPGILDEASRRVDGSFVHVRWPQRPSVAQLCATVRSVAGRTAVLPTTS